MWFSGRNKKGSLLLLLLVAALSPVICTGQTVRSKRAVLMGSQFEITVVAEDTLQAEQRIAQVIEEMIRIENLISEWRPETQISEVNRSAGIKPVKVDREVFELTRRALLYSEQSEGAFDISIAALDRIWRFDGSMSEMPSKELIARSVANVGCQHVVLDSVNCTVFLSKGGMKIGFGSIGKGYAADMGRALMQSLGVQGGIVNASGDLSAWGSQPGNRAWRVGVYNPFKPRKMVKVLKIKQGSVATSGSYEKYAEVGGRRFSHIINPLTGYPSEGLTSVTVWGASAEVANALTTSVMVLGRKKGKQLIRRYPGYRSIFITDRGKVRR